MPGRVSTSVNAEGSQGPELFVARAGPRVDAFLRDLQRGGQQSGPSPIVPSLPGPDSPYSWTTVERADVTVPVAAPVTQPAQQHAPVIKASRPLLEAPVGALLERAAADAAAQGRPVWAFLPPPAFSPITERVRRMQHKLQAMFDKPAWQAALKRREAELADSAPSALSAEGLAAALSGVALDTDWGQLTDRDAAAHGVVGERHPSSRLGLGGAPQGPRPDETALLMGEPHELRADRQRQLAKAADLACLVDGEILGLPASQQSGPDPPLAVARVAQLPSAAPHPPCRQCDEPSAPEDAALREFRATYDHVVRSADLSHLQSTVRGVLEGVMPPLAHPALDRLAHLVDSYAQGFLAMVNAELAEQGVTPWGVGKSLWELDRSRGAAVTGSRKARQPPTRTTLRDGVDDAPRERELHGLSGIKAQLAIHMGTRGPEDTGGVQAQPPDDRRVARMREVQQMALLRMWAVLAAVMQRAFGVHFAGGCDDLLQGWKAALEQGVTDATQAVVQASHMNQLHGMMHALLAAAKQDLAVVSMEARACDAKVEGLRRELREARRAVAEARESEAAASAAVAELMPLSMKVVELERRLFDEISAHDRLKEDHGAAIDEMETVSKRGNEHLVTIAALGSEVRVLRTQLDVQTQVAAASDRRSAMVDSSAALYQEEVDTLRLDAERALAGREQDKSELAALGAQVKGLAAEAEAAAQKIAQLTQNDSDSKASLKLTQKELDVTRQSLEATTLARDHALSLLREYEGGMANRLRKLENEVREKAARIVTQQAQLDEQAAEAERQRAAAAAREQQLLDDAKRLEASLEVRVRERVLDLQREMDNARAVVAKMAADAERRDAGHKRALEASRAAMGKEVERAQASTRDVRASMDELRRSVDRQLADEANKVQQAEEALRAVRRTSEAKIKTLSGKVASLETGMAEMEGTVAGLKADVEREQATVREQLELIQELKMRLESTQCELEDERRASEVLAHEKHALAGTLQNMADVNADLESRLTGAQHSLAQQAEQERRLVAQLREEAEQAGQVGAQQAAEKVAAEAVARETAKELERLKAERDQLLADQARTQELLTAAMAQLSSDGLQLAHRPSKALDDAFSDDDSADGEAGSRPRSRRQSRPTSNRARGALPLSPVALAHSGSRRESQLPPIHARSSGVHSPEDVVEGAGGGVAARRCDRATQTSSDPRECGLVMAPITIQGQHGHLDLSDLADDFKIVNNRLVLSNFKFPACPSPTPSHSGVGGTLGRQQLGHGHTLGRLMVLDSKDACVVGSDDDTLPLRARSMPYNDVAQARKDARRRSVLHASSIFVGSHLHAPDTTGLAYPRQLASQSLELVSHAPWSRQPHTGGYKTLHRASRQDDRKDWGNDAAGERGRQRDRTEPDSSALPQPRASGDRAGRAKSRSKSAGRAIVEAPVQFVHHKRAQSSFVTFGVRGHGSSPDALHDSMQRADEADR